MPVGIKVKAQGQSLITYLEKVSNVIEVAMNKGMREGGKELTDYIKYDLLEGQLVKKRTGELQRGIYYTTQPNRVNIRIRGPHAVVGQWINEGLDKTWLITPRGPWRLKFKVETGPNGGKVISVLKVQHPGIKPRYFMEKAAKAKRQRVESLVRFYIEEALRQKRRG